MASNNFHRLFDCPVWTHDHAGIETDKLKEYILSVQKNDPNGRKVSNVEGWQSNFQHLQTPDSLRRGHEGSEDLCGITNLEKCKLCPQHNPSVRLDFREDFVQA